MPLVCEDLASYGVVLVPPSTAEYFDLIAGIEKTLRSRPTGAPPIEENALSAVTKHDPNRSAILVNRAAVSIAAIAYVWSIPGRNGRVLPSNCTVGTNPSVLLPFGLDDHQLKWESFWNTIFPGSKRLLLDDGSRYGDNTDIRAPAPGELSTGGFFMMGGGLPFGQAEPITLALDGVFFVDGGFAGPDRLGTWDQTLAAAEAHLACGRLAKEARAKGTAPADFFSKIATLTGQRVNAEMPKSPTWLPGASDPESFRKYHLQNCGYNIVSMRGRVADGAIVAAIAAWVDAPVPSFHKL